MKYRIICFCSIRSTATFTECSRSAQQCPPSLHYVNITFMNKPDDVCVHVNIDLHA